MAQKKHTNPPEQPEEEKNLPEENPVPPEEENISPEEEDDLSELAKDNEADNEEIRRMMDQNFIEYASYVIKDRAIPDVDDGLKPVQRRILWAMHRTDNGSFNKVANIVGDTMKFHPHGDASIYSALVVLANKGLFMDRQGNFGNIITGDGAAAMRYIEARLSPLGREVLFNDDITPLTDSYDGRNREPVVLPIKIPSLLLMGSDGIAVGARTNIMPHNFNELLQAQIALLNGETPQLYPDFQQGGIMDASEYEDGNGKLVLRAKIDIEGRMLIIREIPAFTTTVKLMDSIEKAMAKGKLKIASIHDLTADSACIEITPQRGYAPERALQALYQYTDCQCSLSLNLLVIQENRPVQMTVSSVLKRNTDKLIEYLKAELNNSIGKLLDKLLMRTLAQIFVEERIYKKIENCKTLEAVFAEVRKGLEKYRKEWSVLLEKLVENIAVRGGAADPEEQLRLEQLSKGIIPDSEIEKLLAIPIRRISLFDIAQNKKELEELQKLLAEDVKNLRNIRKYAIRYLEKLLETYGKDFPRRTEIKAEGFSRIDVSAIALNNIRVGWDRKGCYVGTGVKSDEIVLCNETDHLLCIERKGGYRIINIPDKVFIDRLYEFRKYDKNLIFGIVYSDTSTGKVYYKRTKIDKFITDKEYRIIPEKCRLEVITPRPEAVYECRIDTPIRARQVQEVDLSTAPLRSPKAGGQLLFPRKLLKITKLRDLEPGEGEEKPEELLPPSEEPDPTPDPTPDPAPEEPEKKPDTPPDKPPKKKPDDGKKDGDDNWGISQMELGF